MGSIDWKHIISAAIGAAVLALTQSIVSHYDQPPTPTTRSAPSPASVPTAPMT